MALSWKSFDFFDVNQVKLADDETRAIFEGNEISCVCSGSSNIFLGSDNGYVRIVGPSWKVVRSFRAHEVGSIKHMRQVEGTSVLVTVAEELGAGEPILKVWALDKPEPKTGIPTCLSTITINNGKKPFPITAFTATEDLSQLAVGFGNGTVTLIRGNLIQDLGTRQRIVHESEEPVTGVELNVDPSTNLTTLFIATTSRILKLQVSSKGHPHAPKTVEDSGCGLGCMTIDKKTGDVVVARDDAIYYYTLDGRGPPRAYESPKKSIEIFQDYVALVSDPSAAPATAESNANRRRFGSVAADTIFNPWTFTLLETDLKLVAHTESIISPIMATFQVWGDLYTLTQDGKVYRYHEKTLQQRLEMIYQRNLYTLAIEIAHKSGMDGQQLNVIYRKYGDYLYQKGNYDEAMTQYIKAIDSTEPSQVIRKFLDTQRIHNLIEYLEELHEHHKATADHTTLLLNCYAKLKDIDKLEKFIKSPGDLKFDLDTAISMCRQGGYFEQAAYLAEKHGENDLVVDILIEDSKKYQEALEFIWRLEPETAYPCLMKYARVLIEHCPKDTTQMFIDYYTSKYRPKIRLASVVDSTATPSTGGLAAGAVSAVQNITNLISLPYMNATIVGSPASQGNIKPLDGGATVIVNPEDLGPPKYTPPPPRTAFSSFIDHPDEFIVFLEACLKDSSLSASDRTDLSTTLFEMYLLKSNEQKDQQDREEWESKAKALISGKGQDGTESNRIPISSSNVLLLSHLSNFRDGTTLVKEQSGLLFDIFRSYTSAKDTRGALKALRKYGPQEPQLYPAALSYLTSDPRILDEAGPEELAAVLGRIDADGLMAPLQVVQTLGKNAVATMGMLKPYLSKTIERERRVIASDRRRAEACRAETEQRRAEMADLGSKPAVFQATRCSDCGLPLELPTVHFLCKHSFHQRCLRGGGGVDGKGEGECPQCKTDNDTIRALRKAQDEYAERHELFKDDLERSDDRFGTVADWFGRGVMGTPVVE
ncbi:vacuolar protein sorting-associated protein 11 [Coniochaeta ligniaria NRRL 30616]|uniref:E3 ubiquitin-protein ligase PEP5 n=1 Tax=Coniochaeta ligniaria NRRL 30616 TaxID=1408157 RepID=A0A1J7JJE2_9PEZI|nr:vacuolar protein sorting-associated protein 11 [Coniochaeta ligniaria NRRL 30616]